MKESESGGRKSRLEAGVILQVKEGGTWTRVIVVKIEENEPFRICFGG